MTEFDMKQFFGSEKVLDKGHVELIDGMVTDPRLKIVNAARVSFNKEVQELSEKDIKLIKFLHEHEHYSTFRHSYFSFRIKAPLMVFRQWWKYQVGCDWIENENVGTIEIPETNWNEASGRYVHFTPDFYIPEEIRIQSKNNKQGSEGKLEILQNGEDPVKFFNDACNYMFARYTEIVNSGGAKEQARMLLPQNIYSECIWTVSLQGVLYFLHQRLKSDAQFEIRKYATSVANLILPIIKPLEINM
jgi:thymidylate synthase (FAD)